MKHTIVIVLVLAWSAAPCRGGQASNPTSEHPAGLVAAPDCVVVPGPTNLIQLRLYTNASPDSDRLFNTFDIEAHGRTWLQGPGGSGLKRWLAEPLSSGSFHSLLLDGEGPLLALTNSMKLIGQASGPDWHYIALDATGAYRDRVEE